MRVESGKGAAQVLKSGNRGDRRGKEIIDGNQHAAQAAPHGPESFVCDGDDTAAFGCAPRDFDILQREKDETARGEQDKKRSRVFDVAIQDTRHIVNGRADIAENNSPREKPSKLSCIASRTHGFSCESSTLPQINWVQ